MEHPHPLPIYKTAIETLEKLVEARSIPLQQRANMTDMDIDSSTGLELGTVMECSSSKAADWPPSVGSSADFDIPLDLKTNTTEVLHSLPHSTVWLATWGEALFSPALSTPGVYSSNVDCYSAGSSGESTLSTEQPLAFYNVPPPSQLLPSTPLDSSPTFGMLLPGPLIQKHGATSSSHLSGKIDGQPEGNSCLPTIQDTNGLQFLTPLDNATFENWVNDYNLNAAESEPETEFLQTPFTIDDAAIQAFLNDNAWKLFPEGKSVFADIPDPLADPLSSANLAWLDSIPIESFENFNPNEGWDTCLGPFLIGMNDAEDIPRKITELVETPTTNSTPMCIRDSRGDKQSEDETMPCS